MEFRLLGSLVDRKIGYGIVQPGQSIDGGVPVIKVNNLIAGLNSVNDLDTTSRETACKYSRTQLKGGELVVSVVGTIGKTAIVPASFAGCNLVRATALIDIPEQWLSNWVKYYIDSPAGQSYIDQNLNTTVQPTLNIKSLVEMPIPFFDESFMKKAVAFLKAIDGKIDINNQMNDNLQQQAAAMYKSWFVDFSFSDEHKMVESEIGKIPCDWRVYRLSEFLPVITGKKNANVSSPKGEYPFFSCSQDFAWTNDYSFEGHAILVAGNGDFNVKWYKGKFEAYQRTYVLIPYEERFTSWLYYAVKYNLAKITSAARGSVIKFITKGNLENFAFAAPSNLAACEIIDTFSAINQTIDCLTQENYRLAALRDTLLPKLMRGEIDVSDIDA